MVEERPRKDWSDNAGKVDHMLSELCLQHIKSKGDATLRGYFRTDQFDRRREVMEAWGSHAVPSKKSRRSWCVLEHCHFR